ncbi:MAG: hypothetical protein K0Q76_1354 [Panacagrimonas sp.]|nr:DUF5924 family protein [Panacagrimonas sp.]MCC2656246.1 hypothetical protein [Panacagrimonas sp.]
MKPRVAPLPAWEPTPRREDKPKAERREPTLEPEANAPRDDNPGLWIEPRVRPAANSEDHTEPRAATLVPNAPTLPTLAAEPIAPEDPEPEGPLFRPSEAVLVDATADATEPAAADVWNDDALPDINADRIAHPDIDLDRLPRSAPGDGNASASRFDGALQGAQRFLDRVPWLLPTASFSIGWLSFFLFQRGEDLARGIALIALLGWPWLLAENLLGRWVVSRSNGRLSIGAVRFVTQQIQQEILFFALPFLFGAMVLEPGQMLFVSGAVLVAILVSIDPVYLNRIAPHAGLSSALHAYCTFIASLVVLPVALHMPLEQALPLSMAITAGSLLLSLPRMLMAAPTIKMRLIGSAALVAIFPLMWASRAAIPPAGLWVREARVAQGIVDLDPGPAVENFGPGELINSGAVAFVSVRAPTGLSQAVVFDWHREGALIDRIPAEISGGREAGFRTYSRKQNFPAESRGHWRVDLRTPQGQLIARMRFTAQ